MSAHAYKTVEITGSSQKSIEDAALTALHRTGESLHSLRWFEVTEVRGHVEDGTLDHWQVTVKIGFTLDDPKDA